jgi:hypothetical protein
VEHLADNSLAAGRFPAAERTGLVAFSLRHLRSQKLPVHHRDGAMPPAPLELSATANPKIFPAGT